MKLVISETEKKEILKLYEQDFKISKSGKNVNINGQDYGLQVYKLGGWKNVDIDELKPRNDGGYDIKASLGIFSQKDVVPADTINLIKNNLGKSEILLGGKTQKKLVKL